MIKENLPQIPENVEKEYVQYSGVNHNNIVESMHEILQFEFEKAIKEQENDK
jgi:hypothetical protein